MQWLRAVAWSSNAFFASSARVSIVYKTAIVNLLHDLNLTIDDAIDVIAVQGDSDRIDARLHIA